MCIILALVIIRKHVRKNGTSVGPILMLSYKNHALEEFLGDVLKFAPELLPGQLIRCGKVELPALQAYSEFNSKDEREAEKELQRCIQLQRSARAASKAWVELSRSQEYRAATAVDAVMRVVQLLVQLSKRWFTEEDEDDASSEHSAKDARLIPSLICAVPLSSDNISDVGAYGDVFPNWVAEVAHWKEVFGQAGFPRQLTALLTRWLSGDRPPPRCTAPECMGYQVKGRKFCRAHLCTAAGCLCQRNESDQAVFCEFHACKFVRRGRCCSMRLAAGDFCSEHSCCTCVALAVAGATGVVAGVEGAPAAVRPVTAPGEACAAHRCAEENCKEAALLPQLYCQAHICLFCVRLPSADGKPATGGDYCCDHECQVDGCNQLRLLSIDDSSYCADHTCRLCSDVVDLTSAETEKSLLCSDHRCAYPDYTCLHEVVEYEDVMMYRCEYHSCFVCHLQGTGPQGRPTTADFPRNVCENHPLCCFPPNGNSAAVVLCGECTVPPSELCDAHAAGALLEPVEELQYTGECHGVTKKGAKCKCKCPDANQFYCAAHMNQAADRAVAQEAPRAVQIDPELVKKRAFEEKLSGAKDETQLAEEAVYTTLVRFDLVHCTHEACLVGGRVPLRADAVEGGWKCPLHSAAPASAVPVPLAPEEQEEALPTDAAPAAPGVQEAMSGFQSKTQLSGIVNWALLLFYALILF